MLFRHKEGRASWVALMSRPPPFTTWNIILFAMIIGPMFSSITGAIFGIFVESAEIVSVISLAFLGWLFGLIPRSSVECCLPIFGVGSAPGTRSRLVAALSAYYRSFICPVTLSKKYLRLPF